MQFYRPGWTAWGGTDSGIDDKLDQRDVGEIDVPAEENPPDQPDTTAPATDDLPSEPDVMENPATGAPADESSDPAPEGEMVAPEVGAEDSADVSNGDITEAPAEDSVVPDEDTLEEAGVPTENNDVLLVSQSHYQNTHSERMFTFVTVQG